MPLKRWRWRLVALAGTFLLPTLALAEPLAFVGARIYPVSAPPISAGVLLVEKGRIRALGPMDRVPIPAEALRFDLNGKVIVPGLVDTHSHIGDVIGGDTSRTLHPEVRALDSVNIHSESLERARAGGITTVQILPGSGLLLSGQSIYLKLRTNLRSVEEGLLCQGQPPVCGGMKLANGTNPLRRGQKGFPETRSRAAADVRNLFVRALDYRERRARGGDQAPGRDLGLEAMLEILDRRRIVHFHSHRADDILTAMRLAREFGFRLVLHHASEGYRVAREIARDQVPVSVNVVDSPGGKHENAGRRLENLAALAAVGVDVAVHTDDAVTDSRFFLRSAALAIRGGLSPERALEALTLAGARMLGLDNRVGSLEPGKDADFVVLSGEPFSIWTLVEETWVEGRRTFSRNDPAQRRFQVGGISQEDSPPGHAGDHPGCSDPHN